MTKRTSTVGQSASGMRRRDIEWQHAVAVEMQQCFQPFFDRCRLPSGAFPSRFDDAIVDFGHGNR